MKKTTNIKSLSNKKPVIKPHHKEKPQKIPKTAPKLKT